MRWVVLWLIAGCGTGLEIEVDIGTTGADHVELFLATQPCIAPDCSGITYESTLYAGDVNYLDNPQVFATCVDPGTHSAVFEIDPHGASKLEIIAVGSHTGTTTGCTEATTSQQAIVGTTTIEPDLDTTGRALDKVTLVSNTEAGHGVTLWRETMTPYAACVAVQRLDDPSSYHVIVPAADPDCDGYTGAQECVPGGSDYYDDEVKPQTLADIHCLVGTSGATCKLGGGCEDGTSNPCFAAPYCVPDGVCASTCLTDPTQQCFNTQAGRTRVVCTAQVMPDTTPNLPCPNNAPASVDLEAQLLTLSATTMFICDDASLLKVPATKLDDFQTSAVFSGATWTATASPSSSCVFDVAMTGSVMPAGTGATPIDVAVLQLSNPSLHMLVPIEFHYTPSDCAGAQTTSCMITTANDEHLWSCGP